MIRNAVLVGTPLRAVHDRLWRPGGCRPGARPASPALPGCARLRGNSGCLGGGPFPQRHVGGALDAVDQVLRALQPLGGGVDLGDVLAHADDLDGRSRGIANALGVRADPVLAAVRVVDPEGEFPGRWERRKPASRMRATSAPVLPGASRSDERGPCWSAARRRARCPAGRWFNISLTEVDAPRVPLGAPAQARAGAGIGAYRVSRRSIVHAESAQPHGLCRPSVMRDFPARNGSSEPGHPA